MMAGVFDDFTLGAVLGDTPGGTPGEDSDSNDDDTGYKEMGGGAYQEPTNIYQNSGFEDIFGDQMPVIQNQNQG